MRNYRAMKDGNLLKSIREQRAGISRPNDDLEAAQAEASLRGLEFDMSQGAEDLTPELGYNGRMFRAAELAPMTCASVERVDEVKDVENCFINPKIDGYRLVCIVEDGKVSMMSRGLKWQDGKLPYIEEALMKRFPVGTVLDGEICALTSDPDDPMKVINDFEHVQSIMNSDPDRAVLVARHTRPLTFHCFDILFLEGRDLRAEPLHERIRRMDAWCEHTADDEVFQRTPYTEATQDHHDAWVHMGFEGSVVKHRESTYHCGDRGYGWTKIKHKSEVDVIIVGFLPGQGELKGMVGATVFAQPTGDPKLLELSRRYIKSLEKSAVKRGGVLTLDRELIDRLGLAVRGACSGYDLKERAVLEGKLGKVISIHHNGLMAGKLKFRHPQFFRDREDKVADGIGWHNR